MGHIHPLSSAYAWSERTAAQRAGTHAATRRARLRPPLRLTIVLTWLWRR